MSEQLQRARVRLEALKNRVQRCGPFVSELKFHGVPIEEFSIEELRVMLAYHAMRLDQQLQPGRVV